MSVLRSVRRDEICANLFKRIGNGDGESVLGVLTSVGEYIGRKSGLLRLSSSGGIFLNIVSY